MKYKQEWKEKSGIYGIQCNVNNKIYVGKSINLYQRFKSHTTALNRRLKDENIYLINAWHKHGSENFEYKILEYCPIEELKEKELYWMDRMESLDNTKGYNLRRDTASGMIPSDETRKKLSIHMTKRNSNLEERKKVSEFFKEYWKDPVKKASMAKTLSKSKEKYDFLKYDKEGNFLKEYSSVKEVIAENPEYKWQNIYAVCNGYKPTYRGYVWKKKLKI